MGKTLLSLKAHDQATSVARIAQTPQDDEHEVRFSTDSLSQDTSKWPADVVTPLLTAFQAITNAMGHGCRPTEIARALMPLLRNLVPAADHVAMLLLDDLASDMMLAAHEPEGDPRVSVTLAKQAIEQKQAFVWNRSRNIGANTIAQSIDEQQLENVLCAPLIWQDVALGVLWLSGPAPRRFHRRISSSSSRSRSRPRWLALAIEPISNWSIKDATLRQIMAHFSPKVANRLLDQAKQGRLRPGGAKSQVTLLCSDLLRLYPHIRWHVDRRRGRHAQ